MNVIKVKPWGAGQGAYVLINASDFNPERHAVYDPEREAAEARAKAEAEAKALAEAERAEQERLAAQRVAEADAERAEQEKREAAARAEADAAAKANADKLADGKPADSDEGSDEAGGKLGIAEIREALTAKGIQFDPKAKKADLRALLDAAH